MFAKDLNSDLYEKKLNFKAFPDSLEQFNLNGHSKSNFYFFYFFFYLTPVASVKIPQSGGISAWDTG